jgi:hypothetical protein
MLLLCLPAAAGQVRPLPDVPGTWQLSSVPASDAKWSGHSEAEGRIFLSKIQDTASRLHTAKVFSPPLGFNGEGYIQLSDSSRCQPPELCANVPVSGSLLFIFLYFAEGPGGKPKTDREAVTEADFHFNDPHEVARGNTFEKHNGHEMMWLPVAMGQAAGVTLYYAGPPNPRIHDVAAVIYFAKRDRPLWIPVTREQFLRDFIADLEGKAADRQAARRVEADKKLPPCDKDYKDWMAGQEERRKTHEQEYQTLKRTDPSQAELFRTRMEKMEADFPGQLKQGIANCEGLRKQVAQRAGEPVAPDPELERLRAELAGMTPGERASQAWVKKAFDYPSPFVPANTKDARAVVRFNPDYFDLSRPRTDIQLITVFLESVPENLAEPPLTDWDSLGLVRLWEFVNQVDWQRLATMISE